MPCVVSTGPLFSPLCTGTILMGDIEKNPGDEAYVALHFPLGSQAWASWPAGSTEWQSRSIPDDTTRFQLSESQTVLVAERAGTLSFMVQKIKN